MNSPTKDRDDAPRLAHGPRRALYLVLGWLFVGLAALGVLLPVLPTTPFLLLAAFFFARSSERFYGWLLHNRRFGPLIKQWREDRSLPPGVRLKAITLVLCVFALSIYLVRALPWLQLLLLTICAGLVIFLVRLPERELVERIDPEI